MATDGNTGLLRVLCVTQPGDGHLNPLAHVAGGLVAAGHDVLFATSRPYVPDVERRGFKAVAVDPDFRWDAALETWPEGANHMGAASVRRSGSTSSNEMSVPRSLPMCSHWLRATSPTFCSLSTQRS